MKKIILLSLLAVGLTGCHTMNRSPYAGGMGEYGFTYDLNASPSPFTDTSYRPLTPYDLAAPIVVVVTNQPSPRVIYETAPEIGATRYSGESPARGGTVFGSSQINEGAGADRGTQAGVAGGLSGGVGGVPSGGASAGGASVFVDDSSVTNVVTNSIVTNNVPSNNFPTNITVTNVFPTNNFPTNFPTNNVPTNSIPTNAIPFPTNREPTNVVNPSQTNQPGRQATNQVPRGATNRSTLNQNQQQNPAINEASGAPAPGQTPQGNQQSAPVQNQQTITTPQSGNAALPPSQGTSQQPVPTAPPASAPANP